MESFLSEEIPPSPSEPGLCWDVISTVGLGATNEVGGGSAGQATALGTITV